MNKNEQLVESFNQFKKLYRSKIELTGEKLKIVNDFDLSARPVDRISYKEVDEVAIKMPKDEYEKFMISWSHYIDLLYTAKNNPIVEKEFHKLLMLAQLSK
jgi:hypothetical protein